MALRRFLSRDGWQVEEAADGRVGFERLTAPAEVKPPIDLIICDLRMPGLGGVELYDRLQSTRPDLLRRLIMATGDAVSREAADFVQRTSCPVLQKPFELTELRALVERVAGS